MADSKVTALTATTAPLSTDVMYIVTDPGGTPTSKKVTLADLLLLTNTSGQFTGILPINRGGTNSNTALNNGRVMISSGGSVVERAALTASALVVGDATNGVAALALGTANQIVGMNAAATANEYKTVSGVANEIDITHAANSITIGIVDPLIVGKGGTGAATFTQDGVLFGNGTSAIGATAQGGTRTILTANAGPPAWSATPIINTSVQIGVASSTTGALKLAHASSANLTTIQAGNATAAVTYTWPTADGANTNVLQTNGAGVLSWVAAGSGSVGGTGTTNTLPIWTAASTLGDSKISQNAGGTAVTIAPAAAATGVLTALTLTAGANTNQTLSTEVPDVNFNLARTVEWATGALTTQRFVRFQRPSVAFVGASVLTTGVLVDIEGPPFQSTNATITNAIALRVGGATTQLSTSNASLLMAGIQIPTQTWTVGGSTNLTGTPTAAGLYIDVVTISNATIVVTNAASLYIKDAAAITGGGTLTNAFAIWSDSGRNRFDGAVELGAVSSVTGALKFAHASSANLTTFQAGNATSAVTYTLPLADGTASQFLQTNGSGTLTWATPSAGAVALSAITAATGSNTIANGDNAQVWQWALTTAGKKAFTINESADSTGGAAADQAILAIDRNSATSTAQCLRIGAASGVEAQANHALVAIGDGTFGTGASKYAAGSAGSYLGINAAAGLLNKDLCNFQIAGVDIFRVRTVASGATGIEVLTAAAASGVTINTLSSGTNEALTIKSKGTGSLTVITPSAGNAVLQSTSGDIVLEASSSNAQIIRFRGGTATSNVLISTSGTFFTLNPTAVSGGTTAGILYTQAGHTNSAASVESPQWNINFAANSVHWATGALTTQRWFRIQQPTMRFAGASTNTTSILMDFESCPVAGTNATITNSICARFGATNVNIGATAAGMTYNTIQVPAHTVTVTGTTQVTGVPSFAAVALNQITVTDSSAVTVDRAATLYVDAAPVAAGSVTLTATAAALFKAGSVVVGNTALATTATNGFLYISGGAGTPTGTPEAWANTFPLYWDSTNKKLYIYSGGAWVGGTVPGGFV